MTPDLLRLHRAALSSGDRAVWGCIVRVDRAGVAEVLRPRWLPSPVSLVKPLPVRGQG